MSATPLGSAGVTGASITPGAAEEHVGGIVWVLEDARRGAAEPALAIAERLGVEFRRVPLWWNLRSGLARLSRRGSLAGLLSPLPLASGRPALTLSSDRRSAAVAAWVKHACGSRMVHYGPAGTQRGSIDLHLRDAGLEGRSGANHLLLGRPHRLTATTVQAARAAWKERLDHLPHPRLALLVGSGPFGAEMQPSEAYRLAIGLAGALHSVEGAVLAVTDRGTGREATDALAAGLSGCMHLLYREGEPGPDPELGFLSVADAVVVAGNAPDRLLRACALSLPIYVSAAGPLNMGQRRLHHRLLDNGHIRMLDGRIEAWQRTPLDEAGRAAGLVLAMLSAAPSLAPTQSNG